MHEIKKIVAILVTDLVTFWSLQQIIISCILELDLATAKLLILYFYNEEARIFC